jgi:chlorophyll synthase
LALLYSLGAHGIMTLNDFKSVQGDARMGVRSLPVQLGVQRAAIVACLMMQVPQWAVVAYLMQLDLPWHALGVLGLSLAQVPLMQRFIAQPIERALHLSAFGVPLYVSGMMVSAWGLRSLGGVS